MNIMSTHQVGLLYYEHNEYTSGWFVVGYKEDYVQRQFRSDSTSVGHRVRGLYENLQRT